MQIRINYTSEIDHTIIDEINFIRDEFDILFGQKTLYTSEDRQLARKLLNHLSKIINSANCLDYLTQTLEDLEDSFPTLF
ncbi:MAG: hypothetical protein DRO88_08840 [Promethearchaeia archaeon]|nr:MAG: hypothetical protein DRO88_08840 [Candidatus Lokiarchaeia archaeon]